MKKYNLINLFLSLLLVTTIISCNSKDGSTSKIETIRLKTYFIDLKSSEVKEGSLFTDETYKYDSSFNLLTDEFHTYKYDFDNYGNKVKRYSYNSSGGIFQTEVFKNDSVGNPIEILDYDYKMKDIEHKTLLEYDKMGNLIKQSVYDDIDSLSETNSYEYNDKKLEMKMTSYKYDFLLFKYSYQYDNKNRVIEKTTYENGREIVRKTLYEYDYNGNKTKETIYSLNDEEDLSIDSRKLFKYDKANNLIEEIHISDGKEYKTTFEYNESGKLSKEISSEREILYTYDKNNKVTKTCIRENKKPWWKEEDFYDSNGNKTSSIHYDDMNKIDTRYFYRYNEKNQMILDSCADSNGEVSFLNKLFYKNDTLRYKESVSSHWLLSSEQDFWVKSGDGRFEYTTYQILDKSGNVIEEIIDYVLVQQLEFEYQEFDTKGNWTKRFVNEFGKPYRIETREIKYY